MIVAIYAYEGTFLGLHGISCSQVIDVEDLSSARDVAEDMSIDTIISHSQIMEDFEEGAKDAGIDEGSEEWDEYIDECIRYNVAYEMWEVVDQYDSIERMDMDFYNNREEFIKKHCREVDY